LGDLEIGPLPYIGRTHSGASLPGPIQLLLSREGAWDSQRVMVGSDGAFRFDNVPEQEPVTFVARIPDHQLIQERTRMQQIREWSVAMYVEGPRDDIDIYYEPSAAE